MRSFGFCFGIVWCWRSTSCFRLLASLPYMSISAGVVVSVAFQQVNGSPNAETGTESDDEGLENADSRVEKFHICVAGIIGCW